MPPTAASAKPAFCTQVHHILYATELAYFSEGKVMKMVGSPYSPKDIRGWAGPRGVRDVEGGRKREALAPVQVWSSRSITE